MDTVKQLKNVCVCNQCWLGHGSMRALSHVNRDKSGKQGIQAVSLGKII